MPPALIVGNWKMHGLTADLAQARELAAALASRPVNARIGLCPPATLTAQMSQALAGSAVIVGGQDCHVQESGAFTGDISAEMMADAGARLLIVGHSERRVAHGESDALVSAKALAAVEAGLEPIICIGETLDERKGGRARAVITGQLEGSVDARLAGVPFAVAYEPVWAIGTGLTPTLGEIEGAHRVIRALLTQKLGPRGERVPILYGGSVKPTNAMQILGAAEVGGALVGGASLKAAEFLEIIRAAGWAKPLI